MVLDCSTALAWCFPDEKADYPLAVLDSLGSGGAFVPSIWPLEVANALLVGERRNRCTQADTIAWTGFLPLLPITVDGETTRRAWGDVLTLARSQGLSVYDATYLELAVRLGLPLATLDDKLNAAAARIGVTVHSA